MRALLLGMMLTLSVVATAPRVSTAGDCDCPTCRAQRCNCPACQGRYARYGNNSQPWHCGYYHTEWGTPVALVVPPTAEKSREMGWGVGNTRTRRIMPQFGRQYPGEISGDLNPVLPTPQWPSDTTQFGVYYVRGPW